MGSTDGEHLEMGRRGAESRDRWWRRALRWTVGLVLVALLGVSTVAVLGSSGPSPASEERASGGATSDASGVAVLSPRRLLEPFRLAAADHHLVADLDTYVSGQPEDTCLTVRTSTVSYAHRGGDPQTPASVEKLLTAVGVLTALGPGTTYETTVSGRVEGGVVAGDLHLRGGGDPLLATAGYMARERNQPQLFSDVDALAQSVVDAGITEITGRVVGDETRYDAARYLLAWPDRFISQGVVGPLSGLSVNDGFAYFPDVAAFGAAPDPAAYAATVFDDALRARGVTVGADPASGPTPPNDPIIASLTSPPVADIVTQLLQESDNNTAELLLKELGRSETGEGTTAAGRTALGAVLAGAGLDMGAVTVADGSGLAMENVVTCDLVVDVVDHEPTAEEIRTSLAESGESGTLSQRWTGTDLVGRIHAKTGTLNQVTALAGRAETAADEDARFALIVNVAADRRITAGTIAAQEELAEILVSHPALPDVDSLQPGAS